MIQLAGDERIVEGSHLRHRDGCLSPTASETAARDALYLDLWDSYLEPA